MRLGVTHTTSYQYSQPARDSINELKLTPENTSRQSLEKCELQVAPDADLQESRDLFGNRLHQFTVEEPHTKLIITAKSVVETQAYPHLVYRCYKTERCPPSSFQEDDSLRDYLSESACVPRDPETWREALDIQTRADPTWAGLFDAIRNHIFETCIYREQIVHAMRTSTEVQRERTGTCQDFAHLMLAYLRLLNYPARYCSGYLYDPGLEQQKEAELIGSGVTHAWVEAFIPDIGWVGIDPTNRCWVNDHYITLAVGRDYHDIVPIKGSLLGGGKERKLDVSVRVQAV